jgi:hypothetical protein
MISAARVWKVGHWHEASVHQIQGTFAQCCRAIEPSPAWSLQVRVESTITESNGSSSMASVCGGCLAMLDAGQHVSMSHPLQDFDVHATIDEHMCTSPSVQIAVLIFMLLNWYQSRQCCWNESRL